MKSDQLNKLKKLYSDAYMDYISCKSLYSNRNLSSDKEFKDEVFIDYARKLDVMCALTEVMGILDVNVESIEQDVEAEWYSNRED